MRQVSIARNAQRWLSATVSLLMLTSCLPSPSRPPGPVAITEKTLHEGPIATQKLPVKDSAPDVGEGLAEEPVAAPIISHNGGSVIQGTVLAPAAIISHNGGSIISHNGGSIISHNGGSIISHNGGSIISHNGGSIISHNGGSFQVSQVPVAYCTVRLKDAAGKPVLDDEGHELVAETDEYGNYAFPVDVSGRNLVVHAEVPGQTGDLVALLPKDGAGDDGAVEVDLTSTLSLAYVLQQYVKGDLATFEKLTKEIELEARTRTEEAIVKEAIELPETLDQAAIVAKIEEVRKAVPDVDQIFEEIRQLLIVAGIRNQGDGLPATQVNLRILGGVVGAENGDVYLFSQGAHVLWKLTEDGILHTLVPSGEWGYTETQPDHFEPGYTNGMAFEPSGSLILADAYNNRIVRVARDQTVTVIAGGDTTGFGGDGGPVSEATLNRPTGIAVDRFGNIFFSDTENHRVRKISTDGTIETVFGDGTAGDSGDGGAAIAARLNRPQGLAFEADGSLVVADYGNGKVRRLKLGGVADTVAEVPYAILVDTDEEGVIHCLTHESGEYFRITDSSKIKIDLSDKCSGTSCLQFPLFFPRSMFAGNGGVILDDGNGLFRMKKDSGVEKLAGIETSLDLPANQFRFAAGMAIGKAGNIYVADAGARKIFQVQTDGSLTVIAGNGLDGFSRTPEPAASAAIGMVYGLSVGSDGRLLFTTIGNHPSVRQVNKAGMVSIVLGDGKPNIIPPQLGPADSISIGNSTDVVEQPNGTLLVGQGDLDRIISVADGTASDVIEAGSVHTPLAFSVAPDGSIVFVERNGGRISKLTGGHLETVVAASRLAPYMNFQTINCSAFDQEGRLYIGSPAHVVRLGRDGVIQAVAGPGGWILNGNTQDEAISALQDMAFAPTGDLYLLENTQLKRVPASVLNLR